MPPDHEAIRARADAATPGPWKAERRCVAFARMCPPDKNREGTYPAPYGFSVSGEWVPAAGHLPVDEADGTAEFIAHAREDIPALLAEIAAKDARIAELTETLQKARNEISVLGYIGTRESFIPRTVATATEIALANIDAASGAGAAQEPPHVDLPTETITPERWGEIRDRLDKGAAQEREG